MLLLLLLWLLCLDVLWKESWWCASERREGEGSEWNRMNEWRIYRPSQVLMILGEIFFEMESDNSDFVT